MVITVQIYLFSKVSKPTMDLQKLHKIPKSVTKVKLHLSRCTAVYNTLCMLTKIKKTAIKYQEQTSVYICHKLIPSPAPGTI